MRSYDATSARAGITLVEVMVALVLVAVGLLGIAGSSALAFRAAVAQAGEHDVLRRASLRIARLAASGCAVARDGTAPVAESGVRERWSVTLAPGGIALIDDSLEWPGPGGTHRVVVRSALLC